LPATTPWADAPPIEIHLAPARVRRDGARGPLPRVKDRRQEREFLARQLAEEDRAIEAARAKLADGEPDACPTSAASIAMDSSCS